MKPIWVKGQHVKRTIIKPIVYVFLVFTSLDILIFHCVRVNSNENCYGKFCFPSKPTYTTIGSTASKKLFHFAAVCILEFIFCSSFSPTVKEFMKTLSADKLTNTHLNRVCGKSCALYNVFTAVHDVFCESCAAEVGQCFVYVAWWICDHVTCIPAGSFCFYLRFLMDHWWTTIFLISLQSLKKERSAFPSNFNALAKSRKTI